MQQEGSQPVVLPARLDLSAADGLAEQLRDLLESTRPVTVDASGVEFVSTPCLQILVSALRDAARHGVALKIVSPSAVLDEAVALFNLTAAFSNEELCR